MNQASSIVTKLINISPNDVHDDQYPASQPTEAIAQPKAPQKPLHLFSSSLIHNPHATHSSFTSMHGLALSLVKQ